MGFIVSRSAPSVSSELIMVDRWRPESVPFGLYEMNLLPMNCAAQS
jgi:hypothetical protein